MGKNADGWASPPESLIPGKSGVGPKNVYVSEDPGGAGAAVLGIKPLLLENAQA